MVSVAEWVDEMQFVLGGSRFVASTGIAPGHGDALVVVKPPDLIREYLALVESEHPRSIVELGIKSGGSTALLALAAEPDVLLALELAPEMPPALARAVEDHDLGGRVFTAFGLDQGDRAAVAEFVDPHRPTEGFDLVIDDASHSLLPTRASFEVLFPRLCPGGLFVLEDWGADWAAAPFLAGRHPGAPDLGDRLRAVNQVLIALNRPDTGFPPELVAQIHAAAAAAYRAAREDQPLTFLESVTAGLEEPEIAGEVAAVAGDAARSWRPLSDLVVELMIVKACHPGVIGEVRIERDWVTVRRGPAELALDDFRLTDLRIDAFGNLG